jgi:hypothetical protein
MGEKNNIKHRKKFCILDVRKVGIMEEKDEDC